MWSLFAYKLYDSTNTLVYYKEYWIGGGCAYATPFDIPNLKLGKYVMKYYNFRKEFSDTMILTKEESIIWKTLYQDDYNADLKSIPTVIEELENGDTMRIISTIIDMSGGDLHLITITKKENKYLLNLQSDKTDSKILTKKDIYVIKCFKWSRL